MDFGAEPVPDGSGFRFSLRAPTARRVELLWWPGDALPNPDTSRDTRLGARAGAASHRWTDARLPAPQVIQGEHVDGCFRACVSEARAGDLYRYRVDGQQVPDIASRWQPADVDGPGALVDGRDFAWTDGLWHGRPFHEAVIYELHVGTFSATGDFDGVRQALPRLRDLGVTAIELMPLAETPGNRGWGYDGVLPFAPESAYGSPDALRRLVDTAHALGIMVFIDVVYNHFGPAGNYLHLYDREMFDATGSTPWGDALTFERDGAARRLFVENALYWIVEFHADGLRLDAVHAIPDQSLNDELEWRFVTELRASIDAGPGRDRQIHLILENEANEATLLERDAEGRPLAGTAQWNDDVHHALHVLLTGEREGYYADFADDPVAALGKGLTEGFVFQGQASLHLQRERGSPSSHLPPAAFVNALQNHDQVGNRALGERIGVLAPAPAVHLAAACVLLAPSPPMLFMGEEFAASTPFLYFVDFEEPLATAVREGRRREFAAFTAFANRQVPDPTAPATFEASRLREGEWGQGRHRLCWEHYRSALAFRRVHLLPLFCEPPQGQAGTTQTPVVQKLGEQGLQLSWPGVGGQLHAVLNFSAREAQTVSRHCAFALRSGLHAQVAAATCGQPCAQQETTFMVGEVRMQEDGDVRFGPWSGLWWVVPDGGAGDDAGASADVDAGLPA